MVDLQHLASLRGKIQREIDVMDVWDYRRPEREAARDSLDRCLSVISRSLRRIDETWIGGH